uniref:uronyl 2-sulfotransferase-like isoform X1 n=2 Tax=Ciona intestinalis TaxID=7719 RepID=UPI000EF5593A|nr:uronyl 2-sulfotransferase-like isoform X1 [Ciona intestinalis]|eukprot:XP_026692065.1 uronyl 2-sulfotransferase-like isoform X1 [Ciona intestinalis]
MSVNYPTLEENVTFNVQKEIAGMLRFQKNVIYSRHLRFFDIETFGFGTPIYINIIRDPIDRFVSHYYYSRHGFVKNNGTVKVEWRRSVNDLTLDECMKQDVDKCIQENNNGSALRYFCGNHPVCRNYNNISLHIAMYNAAKYYTTVGLLEEMENSLKVLEALLPRYFKGIAATLHASKEIEGTKTLYKKKPSKETETKLRRIFAFEIEFYQFVRERFHQQLFKLRKMGRL